MDPNARTTEQQRTLAEEIDALGSSRPRGKLECQRTELDLMQKALELSRAIIADPPTELWVWLNGNPSEGFTAYGPYTSDEVFEAHEGDEGWAMSIAPKSDLRAQAKAQNDAAADRA